MWRSCLFTTSEDEVCDSVVSSLTLECSYKFTEHTRNYTDLYSFPTVYLCHLDGMLIDVATVLIRLWPIIYDVFSAKF